MTLIRYLLCCAVLLAEPFVLDAGTLDVQGHRGCRGLMPENTLPAFEMAIALGVTTLELDLQVTRDGVLVVYHDPKISAARCRRDGGAKLPGPAFRDVTWDELADVDCGSRPDSEHPEQRVSPGARIPRLEQVLDLAARAPYPVQVSIEIKLQDKHTALTVGEIARLLAAALAERDLTERAIVQSFDPRALFAMREVAPEIRRSILVRKRAQYLRFIDDGTADILSPKYVNLTEADVEQLRRRKVPVIPWTVNDPADIRRMIRWGVDGIISDHPDRVIAACEELAPACER
jgi:glycerophosphoryl diester phosphodiesterase